MNGVSIDFVRRPAPTRGVAGSDPLKGRSPVVDTRGIAGSNPFAPRKPTRGLLLDDPRRRLSAFVRHHAPPSMARESMSNPLDCLVPQQRVHLVPAEEVTVCELLGDGSHERVRDVGIRLLVLGLSRRSHGQLAAATGEQEVFTLLG